MNQNHFYISGHTFTQILNMYFVHCKLYFALLHLNEPFQNLFHSILGRGKIKTFLHESPIILTVSKVLRKFHKFEETTFSYR